MTTVMLIDDSEADRIYSSLIVSRSGVCDRVVEHECARAALARLSDGDGHDVALILLDINMPGMDGFQFLEAYCELQRRGAVHAAVVMLSSSPDPVDRRRAAAFDCVRGYLVKPIDLAAARTLGGLMAVPQPAGR